MTFGLAAGQGRQGMRTARPNPVVHLVLRTNNLPAACAFHTRLFGRHEAT